MVMQKNLSTSMNAKLIGSAKQTLVLAHGYGGDQTVWEKVLPYLSETYQVLLFDWSFSGAVKDLDFYDEVKYSSYDAFADDLIALMDEFQLSSSVFVGHSMSSMIGCIASVKRPELFTRLVLVSASPRFINTEDYEGGFERSNLDELFANIESNYNQWAPCFASTAIDPNDPASVEKFQACLGRMRPEVALSLAKTVFLSDQRHVLEKVTTPCTLIQTKNDFVVPNSVPKYMQTKINAQTTIEIIDTTGHFPQLTAHVQFLEVLHRAMS